MNIIESKKPFAQSLIWELNRSYYQTEGMNAWRSGVVPHQLTSNALVGKIYAELIFSFLKDLTLQGAIQEKVYIVELGAGHGRLAFHILKHLELAITQTNMKLPSYCYVLSDIIDDSLNFFDHHPQFQPYFEKGVLDVAYFDAVKNTTLSLRYSGITISPKELTQPIITIANYFFDSLPVDLFHIKNNKAASCSVTLKMRENPEGMNTTTLLKKMKTHYHKIPFTKPFYENAILNTILKEYEKELFETYLFFPQQSLQCLDNLRQLSQKGMMLISMDKGFHKIKDLDKMNPPEMVSHGSMSFWVNYHAFGAYCKEQGGTVLFPSYSTFHLELGCLLFLPNGENYKETIRTYEQFIDDFGPDDFNGLKELTYRFGMQMSLVELLAMFRLSAYDSTLFINALPRVKQLLKGITKLERHRLAQTLHRTWDMYFTIKEPFDLAYEIGGILYDLGYYQEALPYFDASISIFGDTADVFYNQALCYYQLRQDVLFMEKVKQGRIAFPDFVQFAHLDKLDLNVA